MTESPIDIDERIKKAYLHLAAKDQRLIVDDTAESKKYKGQIHIVNSIYNRITGDEDRAIVSAVDLSGVLKSLEGERKGASIRASIKKKQDVLALLESILLFEHELAYSEEEKDYLEHALSQEEKEEKRQIMRRTKSYFDTAFKDRMYKDGLVGRYRFWMLQSDIRQEHSEDGHLGLAILELMEDPNQSSILFVDNFNKEARYNMSARMPMDTQLLLYAKEESRAFTMLAYIGKGLVNNMDGIFLSSNIDKPYASCAYLERIYDIQGDSLPRAPKRTVSVKGNTYLEKIAQYLFNRNRRPPIDEINNFITETHKGLFMLPQRAVPEYIFPDTEAMRQVEAWATLESHKKYIGCWHLYISANSSSNIGYFRLPMVIYEDALSGDLKFELLHFSAYGRDLISKKNNEEPWKPEDWVEKGSLINLHGTVDRESSSPGYLVVRLFNPETKYRIANMIVYVGNGIQDNILGVFANIGTQKLNHGVLAMRKPQQKFSRADISSRQAKPEAALLPRGYTVGHLRELAQETDHDLHLLINYLLLHTPKASIDAYVDVVDSYKKHNLWGRYKYFHYQQGPSAKDSPVEKDPLRGVVWGYVDIYPFGFVEIHSNNERNYLCGTYTLEGTTMYLHLSEALFSSPAPVFMTLKTPDPHTSEKSGTILTGIFTSASPKHTPMAGRIVFKYENKSVGTPLTQEDRMDMGYVSRASARFSDIVPEQIANQFFGRYDNRISFPESTTASIHSLKKDNALKDIIRDGLLLRLMQGEEDAVREACEKWRAMGGDADDVAYMKQALEKQGFREVAEAPLFRELFGPFDAR